MDEILKQIRQLLHELGRLTPQAIYRILLNNTRINASQIKTVGNVDRILRGHPGFVGHSDGTFSLDSIESQRQTTPIIQGTSSGIEIASEGTNRAHPYLSNIIQTMQRLNRPASHVQIHAALPKNIRQQISMADLRMILRSTTIHFIERDDGLFEYRQSPAQKSASRNATQIRQANRGRQKSNTTANKNSNNASPDIQKYKRNITELSGNSLQTQPMPDSETDRFATLDYSVESPRETTEIPQDLSNESRLSQDAALTKLELPPPVTDSIQAKLTNLLAANLQCRAFREATVRDQMYLLLQSLGEPVSLMDICLFAEQSLNKSPNYIQKCLHENPSLFTLLNDGNWTTAYWASNAPRSNHIVFADRRHKRDEDESEIPTEKYDLENDDIWQFENWRK